MRTGRAHGAEIDRLIQILGRLPGLGPRSAKRAVLALMQRRQQILQPLLAALVAVDEGITECQICGNLDTTNPCHVCADPKRDRSVICVVEDVADLWAMDRLDSYRGLYHILGGTLSALDGVGPEDLGIEALMARASGADVKEVILALPVTVDGQTTSHFIAERLTQAGVRVTALAHGLPVGGELDYMDDGTLTAALRARGRVAVRGTANEARPGASVDTGADVDDTEDGDTSGAHAHAQDA